MAAYSALVSLMHIIDQIQLHPRPPISLDKAQVEYLTEKIMYLQEFLEAYSIVADDLQIRIADTAYAAEDVIESHIADRILFRSTSHGSVVDFYEDLQEVMQDMDCIDFYQDLQRVIQDMDSLKKEAMEIKETTGFQYQLQGNSISTGSLRSSSVGQNNVIVGFDDVLLKIMDKLIGGRLDRQIIPIVGMGGIGKTTLARNVYGSQIVVQYFDISVWVTISQEYRMREILLEFLKHVMDVLSQMEDLSQMSEYELGEKLHKRLSGRRYLIIMDDIWDVQVWDQLKLFFPDNNNGSRILLTTRLSNLASQVAQSRGIDMDFLDEDDSWKLFSKSVFGEDDCPPELEEIGYKIVENCKGLPLSIVVIGGLLAKCKYRPEYWEYIAGNINSVVNLEDNEGCLRILQLSYNHLPVYLKPCFLYMGILREDSLISVSMLVELWLAEGFLKPASGTSLEEIAEEYLKELIDRNLVLEHGLGSTGNIKYCKIHDLFRDLCLREAKKERFYNVMSSHSNNFPQDMNTQRRIVILGGKSQKKVLDTLPSISLIRSLIWDCTEVPLSLSCRLLRILKAHDAHNYFLKSMLQSVNLRYIDARACQDFNFPSLFYLFWNLHTLIVECDSRITAPIEIWDMPHLRHVNFRAPNYRKGSGGLYLPDPPSGRQDDIVLQNLKTLKKIINFKCGEEVVKRIPNMKKLKISYHHDEFEEGSLDHCLNNLGRLHKIESFCCSSYVEPRLSGTGFVQKLTFPHSLKKLALKSSNVHWEDTLQKIGSLPLLEKLKIAYGSFITHEWRTVEGQFRSLKFLKIKFCDYLKHWTTESSHFPRLRSLVLQNLPELDEIPSGIGEIPSLGSIKLTYCSNSVIISARKIIEQQEELFGEVGLQVRVKFGEENEELEDEAMENNWETPYFRLEY